MNYIATKPMIDLDRSAGKYTYSADRFAAVQKYIDDAILDYDPEYGLYLLKHLERTSRNIHDFMIFKGYTPKEAENVSEASKSHDAGKILQDIENWRFTKEKKTAEQKKQRPEHSNLGPIVFNEALSATGTELDTDGIMHADIVEHIMLYHHERIDGRGPKKIKSASEILQIIGIVDGADGKMKAKCDNLDELSAEEQDSVLKAVLQEMWSDQKHDGEFSRPLLKSYGRFHGVNLSYNDTPRPPRELAFTPNS